MNINDQDHHLSSSHTTTRCKEKGGVKVVWRTRRKLTRLSYLLNIFTKAGIVRVKKMSNRYDDSSSSLLPLISKDPRRLERYGIPLGISTPTALS